MASIRVLLVEDDILDAEQVQRSFNSVFPRIFDVVHVTRFLDAVEEIKRRVFQVVILDLGLPDNKGVVGVKTLMNLIPAVPVIVLTGVDDDDEAMEAISLGAQEFLSKNELVADRLIRTIRHAIKRKQVAMDGMEQTQSPSSLQLEQLMELIQSVSVDVTKRVDQLRQTGLNGDQTKLVSEIEQITIDSAQSMSRISQGRSMFVPLKSDAEYPQSTDERNA